jgi:hypothetical protein
MTEQDGSALKPATCILFHNGPGGHLVAQPTGLISQCKYDWSVHPITYLLPPSSDEVKKLWRFTSMFPVCLHEEIVAI